MTYQVIPYEPRYREQVMELQLLLWSEDLELNDAYFAWKYDHNPYSETPLVYLLMHHSQVIGMRGFYGAQWQFGKSGGKLSIPVAADLVIDPAHRGKDLFPLLMGEAFRDLASQGYDYILNLSGNPINHRLSLRTGWRLALRYLTMRRDTWRATASKNLRQAALQIPLLWRLADPISKLPAKRSLSVAEEEVEIELNGGSLRVTSTPPRLEMSKIMERMELDARLRHVSDQNYLAWRFENPLHVYRFLILSDPEPQAYLVLQGYRTATPGKISIADWGAATPAVLQRLIMAATQLPLYDSLGIWSFGLPQDLVGLLQSLDFELADESRGVPGYRPGLLVRPLDDGRLDQPWHLEGHDLLDPDTWCLRMIYADRY